MPSLSCSLVIPSNSKCCSASLRMPSFSGTLGAGLTGKANGKCFCNSQIASTAGSCSRSFVCGEGFRLGCFVLSGFTWVFSARRRSRNSASCSKPIVQFAASVEMWSKVIPCSLLTQPNQGSARWRIEAAFGLEALLTTGYNRPKVATQLLGRCHELLLWKTAGFQMAALNDGQANVRASGEPGFDKPDTRCRTELSEHAPLA